MRILPIADLPLRADAFADVVDEIVRSSRDTAADDRRRSSKVYRLVNAYSLSLAAVDADYRKLLERGVNLPDGKAVAVALGRIHRTKVEQVRGPSLFESVMSHGRHSGLRHYLLGSDERTLELLTRELEKRLPGVLIVGATSPPFRTLSPEEVELQDEAVRRSRADVVWVALGTPKQDFEAARLADQGHVVIAVGAAFDFFAGTKLEAPLVLRRAGLEWLFRLVTEPRRLWRRYLIGNTRFIVMTFSDLWRARTVKVH